MLQPDQVTDPLHAYQVTKWANVVRVMAEAVTWGRRGARVNAISPNIIITPLARDELTGPRGEGYRNMSRDAQPDALLGLQTKSARSVPCSWGQKEPSSPAATS